MLAAYRDPEFAAGTLATAVRWQGEPEAAWAYLRGLGGREPLLHLPAATATPALLPLALSRLALSAAAPRLGDSLGSRQAGFAHTQASRQAALRWLLLGSGSLAVGMAVGSALLRRGREARAMRAAMAPLEPGSGPAAGLAWLGWGLLLLVLLVLAFGVGTRLLPALRWH